MIMLMFIFGKEVKNSFQLKTLRNIIYTYLSESLSHRTISIRPIFDPDKSQRKKRNSRKEPFKSCEIAKFG